MSRRRRTAARVISFLIAFIMVLAMGASIFASGKHTVRSGESWWSIGQRYGVSYLEIARANGRLPSQHIYVGEVLTIPNKGGGNPASPTPKPSSPPSSGQSSTHKVQRGETWWSISIKYGVNMNTLAQANGKNTQQYIFVGEVLIIPGRSSVTPTKTPTKAPTAAPTTAPTNPPSSGSSKTHTVQRGETWWSIGLKYGVNYHTLAQANGKTAQQYIFIGEVLIIPGTAPAPTATPKPTAAPTATPKPTAAPTATPKPTAAPTATPKPTAAPTAAPTVAPTPIPDLTVVTVAETTDPRMAAESNKYKVIMAPTLFANGPDGGLGLGMMIKTPNNKTIMIDGGMQLYYDGTTQVDPAPGTGELAKVKNWLATHANNQVDTWIISHPHNDHIRVPAEIIHEGSVDIGHVFGVEYPKEIHDAKVGDENPAQSARAYDALKLVQSQGKYTEITAGMTTSVDGVNIQFLNAYNPDLWRENDSSAVLRISFDGSDKVILLLVDIQEEGAARLMSRYPGLLRADVVQMSHHGMDPLTDLYAAIAAPIVLVPASGKVRAKSTVQANTAALASRGSTNYFADGVWTIVEVAKK